MFFHHVSDEFIFPKGDQLSVRSRGADRAVKRDVGARFQVGWFACCFILHFLIVILTIRCDPDSFLGFHKLCLATILATPATCIKSDLISCLKIEIDDIAVSL